jgi:hypothetical protein
VAATPSGGVDEIVGRDGRFGAIATSTAVPAFADAIDRALAAAMRVDRTAMRAHIEARYAAPAVARRAVEVYRDVMTATKTRPRPTAGGPIGPATLPTSAAAGSASSGGSTGGRGTSSVSGAGSASGSLAAARERAMFRLPLVLGLARGQAIERVALLPPALRHRLTIVTSPRGRYADDRELPPWADWLELDQERFYRDALAALETSAQRSGGFGRLKAAFGGPNLDRLRRDLAARKDDVRRDGTERFFAAAAARIPAGPGSVGGAAEPGSAPTWIIGLDADDIVLADRLGPTVGHVAPGGLRWLADRWDAAGRPI